MLMVGAKEQSLLRLIISLFNTFSMLCRSGLESELSPLRSDASFYKPHNRSKSQHYKRCFPSGGTLNPLTHVPEPNSYVSFTGELDKVKLISRGFYHNQLYYPDKETAKMPKGDFSGPSRSRCSGALRRRSLKMIQSSRNETLTNFLSALSERKSKNSYLMNKFVQDEFLEHRAKPTFQNALHHTLQEESIVAGMALRERKFFNGY